MDSDFHSELHSEQKQTSCSDGNSTGTLSSVVSSNSSSFGQEDLDEEPTESTKPKTSEASQDLQPSRDGSKAFLPHRNSFYSIGTVRSNSPDSIDIHPSSPESTKSTLHDMSFEFSNWMATFQPKRGLIGEQCYDAASDKPPISSNSLNELEIERVVHNAKLRHDINFDHELHFRPNLEGERRRCKRKEAEDYWIALETELELYAFMLHDDGGSKYRQTTLWTTAFHQRQRRIPKMFEGLKKIVVGMMPLRDRPMVEQAIDVSLIMQQIQRGNFDMSVLATWLADLLKTHCAPIRDPSVDHMARQLCLTATSEAKTTVKGLKDLFGVLEAMKLDIANHQIRHLRPQLLNATITFESLYNERRLDRGQVNVEEAQAWYRQSCYDSIVAEASDPPFSRFICCLIGSLLPMPVSNPRMPPLPGTFLLDFDRLYQLHRKISTAVNEEICALRLKCILYKLHCSRRDKEILVAELRKNLPTIVGGSWKGSIANVAVEIVRLATKPSSSQPEKAEHASTTDLIWKTEKQLFQDLQVGGELHRHQAEMLGTKLFHSIATLAQTHINSEPAELFKSLVPSSKPDSNSISKIRNTSYTSLHPNPKFDEISRRLTHIIILQWRTWASLVFTPDDHAIAQSTLL